MDGISPFASSTPWVLSDENIRVMRFVVGILGNAASLLLYTAPILTFKRVIEKKSTQDFSCIPYIATLLNCLVYTWYGLPVVSHQWENLPVVTINGVGVLFEISFVLIYFWFSSTRERNIFCLIMLPAIIMFCSGMIVLTFALHDRHYRKAIVGGIGLLLSITMYGSPLVAVKQVIQTESVEFMPFYLSFFSFLTSSLWMAYGLLGHDLLLASPNLLGCPLGILQLLLYFNL
ncbi:PREDICTED: bidirectional sugar transporter SWEET3-like [Nelumbo nucifera]|uniref:Bidirectional sugar transporter SWEET n=1 Tax=Nelumbo nucifera TaxID=4432 RepID=A0A1U8Q7N6_NELNU|nr:PREDICTED: bidirectional sugar transporter SWEET3-like [Nelumbo nucifera]